MNQASLQFTVRAIRTGAFSGNPRAGDVVDVAGSESPIKDTPNTRVWGAILDDGTRAVLKSYRHRNAAAWLSGRLRRYRAEREYDRLLILFEAGVPTCEPLVYGLGRDDANGRFEIIVTREIPHPSQLKAYLAGCKARGDVPDLSSLFQTFLKLHRAGVYHGSLTPNNIVVSEPPGREPSFHIVDLPRAVDFPGDISRTRMAWFDLVHFVHRTAPEAGEETCLGAFDAYGYSQAERERFRRHLATYRPGKALRTRLKYEFGLRAWYAKRGR